MTWGFRSACSAKPLVLQLTFAALALLGPLERVDAVAGELAPAWEADAPVLGFRDFFKTPIGSRGLEPTDTLLRLRDQAIRVQGYMVKEEEPLPGLFMLTPTPVAIAELADGPADYLPASTLFVHLSGDDAGKIIGYRPGIWTLSGVLRLGAWLEPNGRVSYVRLILDDLLSVEAPRIEPPASATRAR